MGRLLGRLHAIGALRPYRHRLTLSVATWGEPAVQHVLASGLLPSGMQRSYQEITGQLLTVLQDYFQEAGAYKKLRLHGDCHSGNLLWTSTGPMLVDFDDSCQGAAIQDLWMCLSGDRHEQANQMAYLLRGYQTFYTFNRRELLLIEPLRTLRMIHHAAWIARRWNDPAFPIAFPWFNAPRYWEEQLHGLQEQLHLLQTEREPLEPDWLD
ncbi:serine/threonine protein kinase [Candidatus Magnetaquicoccus inordinatus]|uniref:serine/threonine protein kinase n=1 Tax=Candidatus Magnetaquicoccus inordinatus TaxID=2496818 RepID=UPI00187D6A40|nr:serine/threonine protein kinase [Candidatus Magnetaquicoccus inordinatus]